MNKQVLRILEKDMLSQRCWFENEVLNAHSARKVFSQQGVWKSHNRMFGKFQTMYFHNRFIQVEMGRGNMK